MNFFTYIFHFQTASNTAGLEKAVLKL